MSVYDDNYDLFEKELASIEVDYPQLHYRMVEDKIVLEGEIQFNLTCKTVNETIEDSYLVQIGFPSDYPNSSPEVREIGGRIPTNFHQNGKVLCLDVPSQVHMIFRENPSILHFIRELLEPYLYAHSYWQKYNGKMPFGQRSHYGEGILEHYSEYFGVEDKEAVMDFLELLVKRGYKQSIPCPCGSKKKIKKCHSKKFLNIYNNVPVEIIRYELVQARKTKYGMK